VRLQIRDPAFELEQSALAFDDRIHAVVVCAVRPFASLTAGARAGLGAPTP
jgi:hypothetical protein